MTLSRKRKLAAAITLGLATSTVGYAQSMKPEDAITARRAILRVIALNFGPLGAMAKGDIPFNAEVFKTNSVRMVAVSTMPLQNYFPDGTDEDAGEIKTRAMPEIWLDWEDFEQKLEKMRQEVAKLAKVAQSGDQSAMKAQVGATGKACKSCHDDYRNK
jgi:cytochrome c556